MKRKLALTLCLLGMLTVAGQASAHEKCVEAKRPLIQIAILLDTSNSMDGLIVQAKSQLWKIVNEFVEAKRNGQRPRIEVALYQYGNDNLSASTGYIQQVLPLTADLDAVSEKLFGLTTNGGSEYCGQVIGVAVKELEWSRNANDLKVIVIAGNEPFTQGPVDYKKSAQAAVGKGVIINTIHCGPWNTGVQTGWQNGARLAEGQYMNIDQDRAVAHIAAPQDDEIARLGVKLNKTYVPYGAAGAEKAKRQAVQDANASSVAQGSMLNRAVFKSSSQYRNDSWDLVDAVESDKVKLSDVKDSALPADLRGLSAKDREKAIAKKAEERKELQAKIRKLNEAREEFVAKKRKEMANKGEETLDSAMIKSMRKQAETRDFVFEE